jgi:penicillin G amidase
MRILMCLVLVFIGVGCSSSSDQTAVSGLDAAMSDVAVEPDMTVLDAGALNDRARLEQLPILADVVIPGLTGAVFVVRTEGNIPHVYASNRQDLMRVYGYLVATDRFWMMDLARRLGSGRLSALFGSTVLSTDITTRAKGLHLVAQRIWTSLSAQRQLEVSAFASGVNVYIDAVAAGELPPPSEFTSAFPLLGAPSAGALMVPFTGEDIAAYAAVISEESACSRDEIERTLAIDDVLSRDLEPDNAQSWVAVLDDLFYRIDPLINVRTTHPGGRMSAFFNPNANIERMPLRTSGVAPGLLERLSKRVTGARRFRGNIVGSNAWAAAGDHTDTGGPMVAGDGHLELTAPAYFHQAGLDLSVLGEEDWHVRGNFMAGIPALGVGTNGNVAWSFTCFYSDTIDYFREVLIVDESGYPTATEFLGEQKPLMATMETYSVRAAPVLGSAGGEVQAPTFELFDGRRLLSAEGRPAGSDEVGIDLGDGPMIFEDIDGDGQISAISYDATFLDAGDLLGGYFDLSQSENLVGFKEAQKKLMVTGSHFVAVEKDGGILATGYHASPCRDNLARSADGTRFASGADPQLLLDGTQYGGFTVLLDELGHPLASDTSTPTCTVPYEAFPNVEDPPEGFVVSANNDPSGLSFDGSIANDGLYIGGPWDIGFRAHRIDGRLSALVDADAVTVESMASIQADVYSSGGARWVPHIIEALEYAQALSAMGAEESDESDLRLVMIYQAHQSRLDETIERLENWLASGNQARSGVETVYNTPSQQDRTDAVATTIFNFWLSAFKQRLVGGLELIPAHRLTDDNTLGRFMDGLLSGRGAGNPSSLATYEEAIAESTLFDDVTTPEVERSRELIVLALLDGLDAAAQSPIERGVGGFGTDQMDEWLWGLRHMVRIDSIIAPFLTDSPALLAFANLFSITPRHLPLVEGALAGDDPRSALPGFPRPGDNYSVDSAEHGFSLSDFSYRAGPVMRMVIGLTSDGRVSGQNIMPGGQSGLKDSPYFADQLAQWLGNRAYPIRFHLDEVLEFAQGKERYMPVGEP